VFVDKSSSEGPIWQRFESSSPEAEYYHVDSKRCHIVGLSEDDLSPQTHLVVMHDIAPSDTTIRSHMDKWNNYQRTLASRNIERLAQDAMGLEKQSIRPM